MKLCVIEELGHRDAILKKNWFRNKRHVQRKSLAILIFFKKGYKY